MPSRILHIDASARIAGSVSRVQSAALVAALAQDPEDPRVTHRDLAATPLPQLDETWVGATFTPADARTGAQAAALELSDILVSELQEADTIVIGAPIYNFGVPAALKAWMDLVARAGLTFRYTENGPEGLLAGKRAVVAIAAGGVQLGAENDYASRHLVHFLGFLGITDVTLIRADAEAPEALARKTVSTMAEAA